VIIVLLVTALKKDVISSNGNKIVSKITKNHVYISLSTWLCHFENDALYKAEQFINQM